MAFTDQSAVQRVAKRQENNVKHKQDNKQKACKVQSSSSNKRMRGETQR